MCTGYGTWGALDGYKRIQCLGMLRVYTCTVPRDYGALQGMMGRKGLQDLKEIPETKECCDARLCRDTPSSNLNQFSR